MTTGIGIRSHAICPGEVVLDLAAVARLCGATEAAIRRSIEDQRVCITEGTSLELALRACTVCLAKAELAAAEVDAVIWCGDQVSSLRLQHELGARRAFTIAVEGMCSELPLAMRIASDLVRGGLKNVLVVSGEKHDFRYQAGAPPSETTYRQIYSDAASATLIGHTDRLVFGGFGSASRGEDWVYWSKDDQFRKGQITESDLPDPIQVYYDAVRTRQTALDRCLADAALALADVDHFSLSMRVRPSLLSLARSHAIPAAKVLLSSSTHLGRSDCLLDLETLLARGEPEGRTLLIMAMTVGVCRCLLVRL